jgi:hypothetical protein
MVTSFKVWTTLFFLPTKKKYSRAKKYPFHSANEDNIRAPDALRDALLKKVVNIFYIVM